MAWSTTSAQRDHYAQRKLQLDAIKIERGCIDCGYNDHPAALDFDHRPGTEKRFQNFAQHLTRRWETILEEIAKCDVRCANCHRIMTFQRQAELQVSSPT